jgi:hypothetical protein
MGHIGITVTLNGPPRPVAPRVWRALAGALGAVCLVAGWVTVVPGFTVLFLLAIAWGVTGTLGSTEETSGLWSSFGPPALWAAGIGLVVLKLGILLLRGRRRLVLFLRRFGDSEATHAVTVATRRIGRSWRLVTLDDARIASVGAGVVSRTFIGAAEVFDAVRAKAVAAGRLMGKIFKFITIAAAWGAAGAAALTAVTTDGDFVQRFVTVALLLDLTHPIDGMPGDLFWICAVVLLGCGALFLAWSALSLAVAVGVLPFLSFLVTMRGVIGDAEWAKNVVVPDIAGIVQARSTARTISRRMFSPRLTVMTVDCDVWQLAVGGLAAVSAVPLIDVSEPSENVLWEIEQMTHRFGPRCVFVGDYDRVSKLTSPAAAKSMLARQQELLHGHRVLAYTNDERGVDAFARALLATFELVVRLPTPVPRPPDPITKQMTNQVLRQLRRDAWAEARGSGRS